MTRALARLGDLVARHAPSDGSEARSRARILELLEATPAPFDRAQTEPGHLTASAIVVDPDRRAALLIFHTKLRLWLQPGGHFDPGEGDPCAVAVREVLEETGVRAAPPPGGPRLLDVDVHGIPARKGEPAHEHFDLRFLLHAEGTDAHAGDGADAVRWVTAADLVDDLDGLDGLDLDPGLRRALAKVEGLA